MSLRRGCPVESSIFFLLSFIGTDMKTLVPLLACLAGSGLSQTEWKLDPAHSAAQFAVRHMMVSTVRGQFGKITGAVRYDPADPSSASVEAAVDVSSIDTREPKRDAHLKSPDFLDAGKYPLMTFKSTRVEPSGPGRLRLTGDLTMHGVRRQVVFDVEDLTAPVKDPRGGQRMGASATARVSRKDFGMTWNRAIETGGFVVGDEVSITLDVELVSAPAGRN